MHRPVMLQELLNELNVETRKVFIDGTAGHGGHARGVLERSPGVRVLLIDQDDEALEIARVALQPWASQCVFVRSNFAELESVAHEHGFKHADAVLLDLGVSSGQLDQPERGFSFMSDGPLDMRMDRRASRTAADVVNTFDRRELVEIMRSLGEERAAGRVASAIVREREKEPIETTARLAEIVARAKGGRRSRVHPATQAFQAIRMTVNRELESLESGLEASLNVLKPGGVMSVISFHSLEDRMAKHFLRDHEGRWESQPQGGRCWRGDTPAVRRLKRRPLRAADEEVAENPRARSAKLRMAERI
jgi:16S rRNA (cytosine1402-N4)-methyltransferase